MAASIPPGLRAPEPVSFDGNVAENWRRFEENFKIYRKAALKNKDNDEVAYILLNLAGQEAIDREKTFQYRPEERDGDRVIRRAESKENPDDLINKFRELCNPQKNVIVIRHKFNSRIQKKEESAESYITDLRRLANDCDFGDLKDDLIRDRIVCGIQNENVRKQMLKERNLTLERAVELCQIDEITVERIKEMNIKQEVDEVRTTTKKVKGRQCRKCGKSHGYGKCPAYGSQCNYCSGYNHYSEMCWLKEKQRYGGREQTLRNESRGKDKGHKYENQKTWKHGMKKKKYRKVYELVDDSESESDQEKSYYIDSIEVPSIEDEAHTQLKLNNMNVKVKIDTGAKISVMKEETLKKIKEDAEINEDAAITIKAYGGDKFSTLGTAELVCNHRSTECIIVFHVIPKHRPGTTLLGLNDCLKLGLVQLSKEVYHVTTEPEVFDKYRHIFDESKIGNLPVKYKLDVDESVPPVVRPPRRIPIAIKNEVKKELNRMEDLGVIEKAVAATEWVSGMVAAKKKSGEVRICIDPRDLNTALRRPHHPMTTIEEVVQGISGATIFSTLDAKSGFWQIPLAKESKKYTAFNTPFGRYQFCRLPFGLNSSSEVFQRTMEQLFTGYPCSIIVDDILVWGKTSDEHNKNLEAVLQRCEEINLKLNKEKCRIGVQEVSYIGHRLTKDGISPDPEKVEAITSMPPPEDKKALQRLLGMTNYLSKFIPKYSEKTEILRMLLHKDADWCWLEQHQQALDKLKCAIASPPTLQFYNSKEPVVLTCDSSKAGLGAAILQEKPVAYASRALTETETKYAQIEKELLAVTFACKKFNDYIYGRKVVIETDHKPLVTILKKPLQAAPLRLQKMMLQLQRYNFELIYKAGKELHIADTLSRAFLPNHDVVEEEFEVMEVMNISKQRAAEVQQASKDSEEHQKLAKFIMQGWPENSQEVPAIIRQYYAFRDVLTIQDNIILKQNRVLIPAHLQKEYLAELHRGHPGTEATKERAKDTVFWIGIEKDIENMTASCTTCNMHKPKQQKEPMKMHDIPVLPYEIVAADLFEWENESYLVTVDSYSGFYDIDRLHDMTSRTVIMKLKKQFAIHGIPRVLISDNGTQFSSHEFKRFVKDWKFEHITSSPRYPQSNGLAERAVRSAKSVMDKCAQDRSDPYLALLMIRNTPRPGLQSSAERLFSRRTRTTLPTSEAVLTPKVVTKVSENLEKIRSQKKRHYDKTAKQLPSLVQKDVVRIEKDGKFGKKGEVIRLASRPRSYIVKADGKYYERNRRHLLKVKECAEYEPEDAQPLESSPDHQLRDQPIQLREQHEQQELPEEQNMEQRDILKRSRYGRTYKQPSWCKDFVKQ